ncbi:Uba4 protein [Saccharomycopsis crataegensis]|uniref:Uba4 protein n=1 Tax=Saccharomycopsis crataegensis TaxID=43959 RepID=A0AAV5QK55_9ASCO|nr:Uba4 protein [Saccharomycopsis crataegensis]
MTIDHEVSQELQALRNENNLLKQKLAQSTSQSILDTSSKTSTSSSTTTSELSLLEYRRYGRQLLVPQLVENSSSPTEAQLSLKNAKVLVVGAGGLGSPALLYLAASGVGQIGIVDPDTVDMSNLHRQIIHSTTTLDFPKVQSAALAMKNINPFCQVTTYHEPLNNLNSWSIVENYDVVLDCTDTPQSRYLINDACVVAGKPLVSGSGIRTEGQLSIFNHLNGPCYRCFFPNPPAPNSVTACSDAGVIGPCIGLIGTMMAVECLKILTHHYTQDNFKPFMTMYNGFSEQGSQSLRTFKMRGRKADCLSCGDAKKITREDIEAGKINYSQFCGTNIDRYDVIDYKTQQVSIEGFKSKYDTLLESLSEECGNNDNNIIVIDVRPVEHWNIVHLPHSIHLPLARLKRIDTLDDLTNIVPKLKVSSQVFVICRYGNDSRIATKILSDKFGISAKDVAGGLFRWAKVVDPNFVVY